MPTLSQGAPVIEWGGPSHWRLSVEPDQRFRLEPRDRRFLSALVAAVTVAWLAAVWFAPAMPAQFRIAMGAVGVVAGTGIVAFFVGVNRYELRQGPYLVFDGREFFLRRGRRVELADFETFMLTRRWEIAGLGMLRVSYLGLSCKNGTEIDLIHSIYHREVVKLKRALEEAVSAASP